MTRIEVNELGSTAETTDELTDHEIRRSHRMSEDRLAILPLVSKDDHPQPSPQEYPCGCVTVIRVNDGDSPFEMRLARSCRTVACHVNDET